MSLHHRNGWCALLSGMSLAILQMLIARCMPTNLTVQLLTGIEALACVPTAKQRLFYLICFHCYIS